ncbi:hypothetical protein [Tunicatimonas pelagia]|uniref:hypothetical protein n=1 Tax=Tunicatimonas pelagia TaxID=931531 RepID=UPI002665EA0F|nr:hypothetical protein [Tunicatimonas pelagia]WKN43097.1 hypothetical protein P0M28_29080 [Tunicatimonas pelagia]
MKKSVGAIVSVLKPVDDTRMYHKMAQSLARTGKFSVNILGFYSNTHSSFTDIKFHPIFRFNLRSFARLLANFRAFFCLFQTRPNFIIVNTPELAPAVLLYALLFTQTKVFYDIRENHTRNIVYHHGKRERLRKWLAHFIEYLDKQLATRSQQLLVAEAGYFQEKPWLRQYSHLLLENKVLAKPRTKYPANDDQVTLVYTGTISTFYGIWDAIRFAESLYRALKGKLRFVLMGHVTQVDTYQQLINQLAIKSWIVPTISLQPIPHQQLLAAMQEAHFGMISHQILPSIENCFPTRVWEYMHYQLPFFLQNHSPWVDYCKPWQSAIPVDFSQESWSMSELVNKMKNTSFYPHGKPDNIYWDELAFVSAIERALQD